MIRVDGNRVVDALALAVIVSVAVAAGPVTWRELGRDDGRRAVSAAVAAPVAPPVDFGPLKHFAPFGHPASIPGVTGDPTALGLQLRGVLLARPAAASIALISAANGPAKGFGVGATLPGGAILDAVEFDLVVLRVNTARGRRTRSASWAASARPPVPTGTASALPLPTICAALDYSRAISSKRSTGKQSATRCAIASCSTTPSSPDGSGSTLSAMASTSPCRFRYTRG